MRFALPRLPSALERPLAIAALSLPPRALRRMVGPARRSPDGFELDVQVQALLGLMAAIRLPEVASQDVEGARRTMGRSAPTLDVARARDVGTYDRFVPGAGVALRARIYTPPSVVPRGAAPGLVYFHGGGWVVGSIDSHDGVCRALARSASAIVVSIDYRLAPEHPFPTPGQDASSATRWVLENARSLGIDPQRVAVGGDSAGGNLAAVTSLALRGDDVRPAFQLLVYPATDLTRGQPSHRFFREGYFLTKASMDWYLDRFAPDPATHTDPRGSPLFATDLGGLPPAFVVTSGFDPLRDEGRAYAERMRAAGVSVEYECVEGAVHGVFSMAGALRVGARMLAMAVDRLTRGLG